MSFNPRRFSAATRRNRVAISTTARVLDASPACCRSHAFTGRRLKSSTIPATSPHAIHHRRHTRATTVSSVHGSTHPSTWSSNSAGSVCTGGSTALRRYIGMPPTVPFPSTVPSYVWMLLQLKRDSQVTDSLTQQTFETNQPTTIDQPLTQQPQSGQLLLQWGIQPTCHQDQPV
eukprot:m.355740 g.355740  ORF g.355740 m.355740 type:complete len:174 (+) comp28016_c0_seq21:1367-1888(+)